MTLPLIALLPLIMSLQLAPCMPAGEVIDLADVQLVVREMDGANISKVGLKLRPAGRKNRLR